MNYIIGSIKSSSPEPSVRVYASKPIVSLPCFILPMPHVCNPLLPESVLKAAKQSSQRNAVLYRIIACRIILLYMIMSCHVVFVSYFVVSIPMRAGAGSLVKYGVVVVSVYFFFPLAENFGKSNPIFLAFFSCVGGGSSISGTSNASSRSNSPAKEVSATACSSVDSSENASVGYGF